VTSVENLRSCRSTGRKGADAIVPGRRDLISAGNEIVSVGPLESTEGIVRQAGRRRRRRSVFSFREPDFTSRSFTPSFFVLAGSLG
jgi:hypothetical protein